VLAKGTDRRENPRQLFPFQWLLAKPGGAGVSTCTLGVGFLLQTLPAMAIFAVKAFNRKGH
jgi:hypothetical protein